MLNISRRNKDGLICVIASENVAGDLLEFLNIVIADRKSKGVCCNTGDIFTRVRIEDNQCMNFFIFPLIHYDIAHDFFSHLIHVLQNKNLNEAAKDFSDFVARANLKPLATLIN